MMVALYGASWEIQEPLTERDKHPKQTPKKIVSDLVRACGLPLPYFAALPKRPQKIVESDGFSGLCVSDLSLSSFTLLSKIRAEFYWEPGSRQFECSR